MAIKDCYIKKADCNKCKYSEGVIEDKVSCSVFRDLEETVVQCSAFEEETTDSNPKPQYKVKVSYTVPQNSLDMVIEAHSKEEAESIAISIFKQSISVKADADNV